MITISMQLLEEMNARLNNLSGLSEDDPQSIQEAIYIVSESIAKLKGLITEERFSSPIEEIRFFKKTKPQFDGRLIFYLTLLRFQTCYTFADPIDRYNAYTAELKKLQPFYQQHYFFWQYYNMDQTYLDEHYFLRSAKENLPLLDESQLYFDRSTNAPMSALIAKFYGYELLRLHTLTIAAQLPLPAKHTDGKGDLSLLQWTSVKAGLIELIYALHEYGVFNNGQVEVKKIADYFSQVFQIKFGNIYKTYEDIRLRKKNPTAFLDALKSALERRIDRDNEYAM